MTLIVNFPPINPLQEVEVRLVHSRELVNVRPASREQCNCDCACHPMQPSSEQAALSLPTAFYLELTFRCPNRCTGCGNVFIDRQQQRHLPELGWEDWRTILEKIAPSATMVKLTGGEPTRSPHFYKVLNELNVRGIPFVVLTSGIWSNPGKLLHAVGANERFQGFLISLHGSSAAGHELFTRSAGSYLRALQAIREAAGAGLEVSVSTILLRSNLGTLREIADTALALGARNVIFARHIGQAIPQVTLDPQEYIQAVEEVITLQKQGYPVKIGNCIPQCFHPNPSTGCTAGLTFCTIDPTGNLRPCNHSKVVAGNLLVQPLEKLWNSRQLLDWRIMLPSTCNSCPSHARCGGGCKVMYEGGRDLLMTSPVHADAEMAPMKVAVSLCRYSVPIANYTRRTDRMGNLLLGKGVVIPIGQDVESFLEGSIEKQNLAEIEAIYGSPALSFIANLHTLGLIEFT